MFLQNYIQINHAAALSVLRYDADEYELSALVTALYTDPELSEYSESELQAAVMELISDQY